MIRNIRTELVKAYLSSNRRDSEKVLTAALKRIGPRCGRTIAARLASVLSPPEKIARPKAIWIRFCITVAIRRKPLPALQISQARGDQATQETGTW